MNRQLVMTTGAEAVMAMSAPVQADGYLTLFGGLGWMNEQSVTLRTIASGPSPLTDTLDVTLRTTFTGRLLHSV